jgi:hypothetical protein
MSQPLGHLVLRCAMTASEALDRARRTEAGDRLHQYETICAARGGCRREPLANDSGRWSWCPDCLTVYDDYGRTVNQIRELQ